MSRPKCLDFKRLMASTALALGTALVAAPVQAAPYTYTLDGGSYTGTIGPDSFTNASIMISMTADSDSKVSGTVVAPPYTLPYWAVYGTPTFTITQGATTWTGTLLTTGSDAIAVVNVDYNSALPTLQVAGFAALGVGLTGLGVPHAGATIYDLSSLFSVTNAPSAAGAALSTSIGDLVIASTDGVTLATFSVAVPAGVPLPLTLPLLLGGLGLMVAQRRQA